VYKRQALQSTNNGLKKCNRDRKVKRFRIQLIKEEEKFSYLPYYSAE